MKKAVTLADIRSDSATFRAANPHLFTAGAKATPARAPGADSSPVSTPKGIRTAPKPKTRPEREMNELLRVQFHRGEILSFEFEQITLSIGDGTTYKPDFTVWLPQGRLRFVEVKGEYIRPDSVIKFKCAKGKFSACEWELWSLQKEGWTRLG